MLNHSQVELLFKGHQLKKLLLWTVFEKKTQDKQILNLEFKKVREFWNILGEEKYKKLEATWESIDLITSHFNISINKRFAWVSVFI